MADDQQGKVSPWGDYFAYLLAGLVAFLALAFGSAWFLLKVQVPNALALLDINSKSLNGSDVVALLTGFMTFWGGIAVAVMWSWRNAISNRQANAAQLQAETARKQAEVALKTQISTDLAKAYEQLGSETMAARIGAIYTLEKVMRDVQDTDFNLYWSIIETLSGFARERSREFPTVEELKAADPDEAATMLQRHIGRDSDIRCVMSVIGRRRDDESKKRVDLRGVFALGFSVYGEVLSFRGCDLRAANLHRLILKNADLSKANFGGANLYRANLPEADLSRTILRKATLESANLSEANLSEANLREADLSGANLKRADLSEANLREADLSWADLLCADLSGAKGLTQDQINAADGDKDTKLPDGLTRPEHWLEDQDKSS